MRRLHVQLRRLLRVCHCQRSRRHERTRRRTEGRCRRRRRHLAGRRRRDGIVAEVNGSGVLESDRRRHAKRVAPHHTVVDAHAMGDRLLAPRVCRLRRPRPTSRVGAAAAACEGRRGRRHGRWLHPRRWRGGRAQHHPAPIRIAGASLGRCPEAYADRSRRRRRRQHRGWSGESASRDTCGERLVWHFEADRGRLRRDAAGTAPRTPLGTATTKRCLEAAGSRKAAYAGW